MIDMGKIISVFSHKGGVGKTTFVYNLGYELASMGKKVLLIDADSQMNLTASIHGLSSNIEYTVTHGSKWQDVINNYESCDSYLKQEGVLPLEDKDKDKGVRNIFTRNLNTNTLPINVDILGSSISIIESERKLYNFDGNEDRPKKFQDALRKISQNYDFTLIDTSPSAGSTMNGLFVFSGDYLIVPASPTFFSLQAIDNLFYVLNDWHGRLLTSNKSYGFRADVKFLGIVFQMAKRFKMRGGNKGKEDENFAKHSNEWMGKINDSAKRFQIDAIRKEWAIDETKFSSLFGNSVKPFIIDKCCDFTPQLRTHSDALGVPILALNRIEHKKVKGHLNMVQYKIAFEETQKSYKNIASGLLKL